jgi:hypothetical protein
MIIINMIMMLDDVSDDGGKSPSTVSASGTKRFS